MPMYWLYFLQQVTANSPHFKLNLTLIKYRKVVTLQFLCSRLQCCNATQLRKSRNGTFHLTVINKINPAYNQVIVLLWSSKMHTSIFLWPIRSYKAVPQRILQVAVTVRVCWRSYSTDSVVASIGVAKFAYAYPYSRLSSPNCCSHNGSVTWCLRSQSGNYYFGSTLFSLKI